MSDLTKQLNNLLAENKRKIEQLELQNLYAHKLLSLTQSLSPESSNQLLEMLGQITPAPTTAKTSSDVTVTEELHAESYGGESVADVILQILQEKPGVPMKSIDIFTELQKLRPETPRSTFDAVINRLEEEHDDVVRLKRGVYQLIRN